MKKKVTVIRNSTPEKATRRMTIAGITGNLFLAAFKFAAGIFGHSSAMFSDAVHTLSDIFATLIAFIGVQLSEKKADRNHPYGHERLECVASLLLGGILFATGASLLIRCLLSILLGTYKTAAAPGMIAVIAAVVSILVKECMFRYTMHYARLSGSGVFKADAWHHRSDALSSIGALIGILGARMGCPVLDQAAGLVICAVIIWVSLGIFRDAIAKMLDTSCGEEFENELKDFVLTSANEGRDAVCLDLLRTRKFGERIYADMEISVNGSMSLKDSHAIAERLHDSIEQSFPDIKHIMIHVNPAD